ncbi:MAG: AraC family transcriptional regulator [Acetanaerobacterium sp.]
MLCTDPGVLPNSEYYFSTPSQLAKYLFYYMVCIGSYECAAGYHVRRESYNSALLMLVEEGECTVKTQGRCFVAHRGDLVLLNCYTPHEYYTDDRLKIIWLHFAGAQSLEFINSIYRLKGAVLPGQHHSLFSDSLYGLLEIFKNKQSLSESSASCIIHKLLCNLVSPTTESGAFNILDSVVNNAVQYIKSHYAEPLSVEEIARHVSVSPSHFSRLFKRETGNSPYEYVLNIRLDKSKKLLKQTNLSVAQISECAGFNSLSNFAYTFHTRVGITPTQFRSTPF